MTAPTPLTSDQRQERRAAMDAKTQPVDTALAISDEILRRVNLSLGIIADMRRILDEQDAKESETE